MASSDRYKKSPKIGEKDKPKGAGEEPEAKKKAEKTAGDKKPTKHEKTDGEGEGEPKPEIQAGDDGVPVHARHAAERGEMHQRHMREHSEMQGRHEREHMMHDMGRPMAESGGHAEEEGEED